MSKIKSVDMTSSCDSTDYSSQSSWSCNNQNSMILIWMIILLVLIFIVLVASAWSLQSLASNLQNSVVIPLNERLDALESRFASIDVSARNASQRLESFSDRANNLFTENAESAIPDVIKNFVQDFRQDIKDIKSCFGCELKLQDLNPQNVQPEQNDMNICPTKKSRKKKSKKRYY
jgi:hypothetical protein